MTAKPRCPAKMILQSSHATAQLRCRHLPRLRRHVADIINRRPALLNRRRQPRYQQVADKAGIHAARADKYVIGLRHRLQNLSARLTFRHEKNFLNLALIRRNFNLAGQPGAIFQDCPQRHIVSCYRQYAPLNCQKRRKTLRGLRNIHTISLHNRRQQNITHIMAAKSAIIRETITKQSFHFRLTTA